LKVTNLSLTPDPAVAAVISLNIEKDAEKQPSGCFSISGTTAKLHSHPSRRSFCQNFFYFHINPEPIVYL
jgi:hypothetical protein